jgi:hypothetical protein
MPKIVEVWVDPSMMYRPSPDPEIIDHEAALDFPWNGSNYIRPNLFDPAKPEDQSALVWDDYCKPVPCKTYVKDGVIVNTHKNDYESWFINRKANIYSKTDNTPYPWTGLGYTYDYGPSPNGVGFSEFVVVPSMVGVQRQEDVHTYFRPHRQTLSVTVQGKGRVTSKPFAISCAGTCTASFGRYTKVNLTATAPAGWQFKTWINACADAGSSPTCTIAMFDNQTVEAVFEAE